MRIRMKRHLYVSWLHEYCLQLDYIVFWGIYPTIDFDQEIPYDHFTNPINIVVKMNVYRVRYVEESMMDAMQPKGNIHDELFVIGEDESLHYGFMATILGIIVISIALLWNIIRLNCTTNSSSNYAYMLLSGDSWHTLFFI